MMQVIFLRQPDAGRLNAVRLIVGDTDSSDPIGTRTKRFYLH
jgi:hypothetical protein